MRPTSEAASATSESIAAPYVIRQPPRRWILLDRCVFMVREPNKVDPDDSVENHHTRMWPSGGILRARPWWVG
jgi:hypothetical protein